MGPVDRRRHLQTQCSQPAICLTMGRPGGVIVGLLEDQVLVGLNPPTHPNGNKSLIHSNSRFAHYYCFSFV